MARRLPAPLSHSCCSSARGLDYVRICACLARRCTHPSTQVHTHAPHSMMQAHLVVPWQWAPCKHPGMRVGRGCRCLCISSLCGLNTWNIHTILPLMCFAERHSVFPLSDECVCVCVFVCGCVCCVQQRMPVQGGRQAAMTSGFQSAMGTPPGPYPCSARG